MNLDYYQNIPGWTDFYDVYDMAIAEAPPNSIFVELGVSLGKSTIYMASRIKASGKAIKFYAVDAWDLPLHITQGVVVKAENPNETDITYHPPDSYSQFLAHMAAAEVEDAITPLKMMTVDAAKLFADESLYFVFCDASHAYEPVLLDIKSWYPKVCRGGLMGGHDYEASETPGPSTGGLGPWNVSRAVHEFFGRNNISQHGNSWLRRKV